MESPALSRWLMRLEARSPQSRIDLGLERVAAVLGRLDANPGAIPVITVAGTNGKGSTVALCESILLAAGYRPFAYTSPHIVEFSERMRIGGEPAAAEAIVAALETVEQARGDLALTYFEHITLAALVLATRSGVDALLLEVGLGGRLDAVNAVDADVAVITSIGLDHVEWLGPTREVIAREKSGIARRDRPVIVGECNPPEGMIEYLNTLGARALQAGHEFSWKACDDRMVVMIGDWRLELPRPALAGTWQMGNAACAIAALAALSDDLPVDVSAIAAGLEQVRLAGRMQCFGQSPRVIADVAHNEAAARMLAEALGRTDKRSFAVFSALEGKDAQAMARELDHCFSDWLVAPLSGDRGRNAGQLIGELRNVPVAGRLKAVESVPRALREALDSAGPDDRIVVFGSFRTVAEAWPTLTELT